jgi:arabinofuranosyltransferase
MTEAAATTVEPTLPEATSWPVPGIVDRLLGRFDQARVTAALGAAAVVVGFLLRWTQDDSYISLRYARNLVEGHGLVYNPGEQVEGYTNFLWTVLMAVPLELGVDPVEFGHLVGLACMVATIVATSVLGARAFGNRALGNVAVLVLLSFPTFIAYGTGGLETQLQTALTTWVWALSMPVLMRRDQVTSTAHLAVMSTLTGLAVLTRIDSLLVLVVPLVAVFWHVARRPQQRPVRLVALLGPAAAIVVPWTVWRVATYGGLLPNTATAKSNPLQVTLLQGGSYLALFVAVGLLFAFVPTALVHGRELLRRRPFAMISLALGIWVVYLLRVGGDFMEFRFMVAILPLLSVLLLALVLSTRSPRRQVLLSSTLIAAMLVHAAVMGATGGLLNVESTGNLDGFVTSEVSGLEHLGREIGAALGGSAEAELPDSGAPIISTGGAGAIPYFARLRNVDQLGLTDPWTARNGLRTDVGVIPKQGHSRVATFEHLVDEDVTLLIGRSGAPRPEGYGLDDLRSIFWGAEPDLEHLPEGASMVEIPVSPGVVFASVYLQEHPAVEQAIESGRWVQRDLSV